MEIQISELAPEEIPLVRRLVAEVITDSFQGEGINLRQFRKELMMEIFAVQKKFAANGSYHFLVARLNNDIVGTSGYGPIGKPIKVALEQLNLPEEPLAEILSFYIHPSAQGQGVGSLLLTRTLQALSEIGQDKFSLSTGYQKGKAFWGKKLGEPSVTLPKYYGEADCRVWFRQARDFLA